MEMDLEMCFKVDRFHDGFMINNNSLHFDYLLS